MRLLFITKIFLETTKITVGGEGVGRSVVFLLLVGIWKTSLQTSLRSPLLQEEGSDQGIAEF